LRVNLLLFKNARCVVRALPDHLIHLVKGLHGVKVVSILVKRSRWTFYPHRNKRKTRQKNRKKELCI